MSYSHTSSNGYITNNQGTDDFKVSGDLVCDYVCPSSGDVRVKGDVGVGTKSMTLDAAAALTVDSSTGTKGIVLPAFTTTQRDAVATPPTGMFVYNSSTNKLNFYNGSAWEAVTSA